MSGQGEKENKKKVRFAEFTRVLLYSLPCDHCLFETNSKREFEDHMMLSHQIAVSFFHPPPERTRNRHDKRKTGCQMSLKEVRLEFEWFHSLKCNFRACCSASAYSSIFPPSYAFFIRPIKICLNIYF